SGAAAAVFLSRYGSQRRRTGGLVPRPSAPSGGSVRRRHRRPVRPAQRPVADRPGAAVSGGPFVFHGSRSGPDPVAGDLGPPRPAVAGGVFRRPSGPAGGVRPGPTAERRGSWPPAPPTAAGRGCRMSEDSMNDRNRVDASSPTPPRSRWGRRVLIALGVLVL